MGCGCAGRWAASHCLLCLPAPPRPTTSTPICCSGARSCSPSLSSSRTWLHVRTTWEILKVPKPKPHPRLINSRHWGGTQVAVISEATSKVISEDADKSENHCLWFSGEFLVQNRSCTGPHTPLPLPGPLDARPLPDRCCVQIVSSFLFFFNELFVVVIVF